ncbi:MAG: hypothetical protein U0800_16165 [Isosphaeraceae bacterium]
MPIDHQVFWLIESLMKRTESPIMTFAARVDAGGRLGGGVVHVAPGPHQPLLRQ